MSNILVSFDCYPTEIKKIHQIKQYFHLFTQYFNFFQLIHASSARSFLMS